MVAIVLLSPAGDANCFVVCSIHACSDATVSGCKDGEGKPSGVAVADISGFIDGVGIRWGFVMILVVYRW